MTTTIQQYHDFLASKRISVPALGFDCDPATLSARLFPWQRDIVARALRIGRYGLFEECGLGKTGQQLAWADAVIRQGGVKRLLILCPLAVSQQTLREAAKFEIQSSAKVCREQSEVDSGITITNYERLHKFDPSAFDAVVLDESSILKSYMGKTKQQLLQSFKNTRYKLACTATPAPNDLLELGNHAEFLNVMPSNEMIARWFINNTMQAGDYRLKHHAAREFWKWVASWSVAVDRPSDLGYPDDGFALPELKIHRDSVEVPESVAPAGMLFSKGSSSAAGMHAEKRVTADRRAARVGELVNGEGDGGGKESWAVWCDTNYEADELVESIGKANCVEVRGDMSPDEKEAGLVAFSLGQVRVIVTKPDIAGFGLNWQHCHKTAFVGLSYSFEKFYQAIRRLWRFGQLFPVDCHVIETEGEAAISDSVFKKAFGHGQMKNGMVEAMRGCQMDAIRGRTALAEYRPAMRMQLPEWCKARI